MLIPHFCRRIMLCAILLMVCSLVVNPTYQLIHAQDSSRQYIESEATQVTPSGHWSSQVANQASGGRYLYSSGSEDDTLSLTFEGTTLEVIYVAGPRLGTLALEVDGTVLRTVITAADETAYAQSSVINYLTDESHTLKVYAQEGGVIAIDAFVIPQPTMVTPTPTPTEEAVAVVDENSEGGIQSSTCAPISTTHAVSRNSVGQLGNSGSVNGSMSADGRYVAFDSTANNLVAGDTNGVIDTFVYDRQTCTTTIVSVSTSGVLGNGGSSDSAISGDGRYVAFMSSASNLVPNDTNGQTDVFVHDRMTSTTTLVSFGIGNTQSNNESSSPTLSNNGRFVGFRSLAGNLVTGDTNGVRDIFVHDRQTNTTVRVSVATGGTQANDNSFEPSLSSDGHYIAFESSASNLVANDTNSTSDMFVHDRITGTTTRVSVGIGNTQSNDESNNPNISGDGRYVVFASSASNLVPGDTNNADDVFVYDRQANTTTRASVASGGTQSTGGYSGYPGISGDGRLVAFASTATNLVPNDTNGREDIFVHDLNTKITTRVSVSADGGAQATSVSGFPAISADGGLVAFGSLASNLIVGDLNGSQDVFVTSVVQPAADNLAVFSAIYKSVTLLDTLADTPPAERFTAFSAYTPNGNGQWVMGDWNGDGLKTPGVYAGGAFFYTNKSGESAPSDWLGLWIGITGPPVAGRFHNSLPNDCIGAVEQSGVPTQSVFVLYYTCNLTGDVTPGIASQWLSSPLPTSGGFTGTYQFAAGDFNNDGLDSIAVRRGPYIAFGNVAPVQGNAVYDLAQYIGTPSGNDEGILIVGDWDSDRIESFGLFYQNGEFFYRNDLQFNTGVYSNQSIGRPFAGVVQATSWR